MESVLHLGSVEDKVGVCRILLNHGAKSNLQDKDGNVSFHSAIINNSLNVFKYLLLEKHADPYALNAFQCSPLHLAAEARVSKFAEEMLLNTAVVDAESQDGNTPLHLASTAGSTSTVKLLAEWRANVNALNKLECTPLHAASL